MTLNINKYKKKLPKYFNEQIYLRLHPDVKKAGVDPSQHYIDFGQKEGRLYLDEESFQLYDELNLQLPFDFHPEVYLKLNPDLKNISSPSFHYLNSGRKEGRLYSIPRNSSFYFNDYSFISSHHQIESSWQGHSYFVAFLMSILKPKIIVELGVYKGFSLQLMSFIAHRMTQKKLYHTSPKIFGIDSFQGDDHAIYNELNIEEQARQNCQSYNENTKILKGYFNTFLEDFPQSSIDLLHIDGDHKYESVKNDFETWKDKLSDNAVVLFHDTQVETRNFGVKAFFAEISKDYPHIDFIHSSGLGVLFYGKKLNKEIKNFITNISDPMLSDEVIYFYKYYHESKFSLVNSIFKIAEQVKKEIIFYSSNRDSLNNAKLKKICVLSDDLNSSLFTLRLKDPYVALTQKNEDYCVDFWTLGNFDDRLVEYYDIFVFHRYLTNESVLSLRNKIQNLNKKIIYDLDDFLIGQPPIFLQGTKNISQSTLEITKDLIKSADLVTVGSLKLKDQLLKYNNNTHCIMNALDKNIIQPSSFPSSYSNSINLIVSSTDTVEIKPIIKPLQKMIIHPQVEKIIVVGLIQEEIKKHLSSDKMEFYPLLSFDQFNDLLRSLTNTVGLIPLDNSEFSNCKSPIKFLNYNAFNIPAICSNVPPYQDIIQSGSNGFLANSDQDWIEMITALMKPELRAKMTLNTKQLISSEYNHDVQSNILKQSIQSLLA